MGSTIPLSCPHIKAFKGGIPSLLKGIETASPSGKFCKPIPIARFTAFEKVAVGLWPMLPKPTPTAMPSGKLCSVIAITKSRTRRKLQSVQQQTSVKKARTITSTIISSFPIPVGSRRGCNTKACHWIDFVG